MTDVGQLDGCRLCAWVCGVGHVDIKFTLTAVYICLRSIGGQREMHPAYSGAGSGADTVKLFLRVFLLFWSSHWGTNCGLGVKRTTI
jgi:hypothetical protein